MKSLTRSLLLQFFALIGVLSSVVAFTPLTNLLARPLLPARSGLVRADAIVVLSGGHYHDGTLNAAALERTVTGVRLFRLGVASVLMFTGGPCCGQSTSSRMADLAVELGVPRSAILLEESSTQTHDSAVFSRDVLRAREKQSVVVVTSGLHALRAQLAFEKVGIRVVAVATWEQTLSSHSGVSERVALLDAAIHEYLGLVVYRIRAWI